MKALTSILKENLRFKQLGLNDIKCQKKRAEKQRLLLVISSIRVSVVAKTDVPKKVQLLKISKVMQLL